MTVKRKIIITAVCVAVVAGGTFGGYKFNESRKNNKAVAKVVPVSYMSGGYWGNELQMDGMITSGDMQAVKQDQSMLIDEILVKEGDVVEKDTPLIKYDVTLMELELKQKKNNLAVIEDNIKLAKKEITRLQNLQPSEALPPMPESTPPPVPEKPQVNTTGRIVDMTTAISGNGSQNDPYTFNCSGETAVTAEFLEYLQVNSLFADFNVYINNSRSYMWSVSGAEIPADSIEEWIVGANVQADGMGNVIVNFSTVRFGSFKAFAASEDEEYIDYPMESEDDFYSNYLRPGSDDYVYSRTELAKMVSNKQEELKKLEIDKKTADVEYRKAESQNKDGVLKSSIDGVVTMVNDGSDPENTDPNVLIIQGDSALSITSSIGEYNLDKISVGDMVMVTSYETGASAMAEVKSIDTTPVENYYSWNENPNSSGYTFTADIIDEVEGFNVNQWVGVNFTETETSNSLYIPLHYVREENDRYYVFKAGDDGKLKKQYLKTGAIMYGSTIEVRDGLSESDKICFPYGKDIKEGIKTEESDEVVW